MSSRTGYTLIEVIVAMFVFTVGGLALASGSATIARTIAATGRRELATRIATSRIERMRSQCGTVENGADTAAGVRSSWRVVASPGGMSVEETVSYPTPFGIRSQTFHGSFACP